MLASALLALVTGATPTLPWIHDDWADAKKKAIAAKKLVAVDVWATWCHTCLSMKNYTLEEKPLAGVAGTHVWLSLDYDREKNAGFFGTFPVAAFPTFLVVDPATEQVVARWVGSGTADQMAQFFAAAKVDAQDPLHLGARALATGDAVKARAIYEAALGKEGVDQTRVYNGLLEALSKIDPKLCAQTGLAAIEKTNDTAPGIDAVLIAADCASELDDAKLKAQVQAAARARLERASTDQLAVDDQSGLYASLADLYDQAGDTKKGDATTEKRLAVLEKAAAAAKTPLARATFDPHRTECYIRLKKYAEAEAMLTASQKALPKDYNPPARLALVYRAQGDTKKGLEAINHALGIGYGPRKVRLHSTKIDILIDAKRFDEAKKAIAAARADIAKIDPKLVRAGWSKGLDAQAAKIDQKPAS